MKVGIIGTANAGKSSLFNRLVGSHRAIITEIPGTTRELLRDHAKLHGMRYELVDSPGLYNFDDEKPFIDQIISEADIFIVVVNHREGLTANDREIIALLRRAGKLDKALLLINKVDSADVYGNPELVTVDYISLGMSQMTLSSTQHGYGMEYLIDWITDHPGTKQPGGIERISIAIVGKPNAGKSTMINHLCKTMVAHVSDVAGTTLDYLMGECAWGDSHWRIYDTAGIRRKGRIHGLEKIAFDKTLSMIKFIKPICFLMVDAGEGWTNQDMTLLGEMIELAVPCIVVLNKADLLNDIQLDELKKVTAKLLTWAPWIPVVNISARDGVGIEKVMRWAKKIHDGRDQRVSTHKLNDTLKKARLANPPRFPKNKVCKFYYATQVEVKPLTVVLFINDIGKANYAFTRWVQNVLRAAFGLDGVPIVIKFKDKEEDGQKWENKKFKSKDDTIIEGEDQEQEDRNDKRRTRGKASTGKDSKTPTKPLKSAVVKIVLDEDSKSKVPRARPTRKDGHPLRRTRFAKQADKDRAFVKAKKIEKQTANLERKRQAIKAKRAAKKG